MSATWYWRLEDAAEAATTKRRYAVLASPVGSELDLYAPRCHDP